MAEGLTTRILRSVEEVRELRTEWQALQPEALDTNPFLSFGWLTAWWESFAQPGAAPLVITTRRGGQLLGIAPFCVVAREPWRGRRMRTLRFWANPSSNRISLIVRASDASEAVDSLVGAVAAEAGSSWDVGFLGPLVLEDQVTRLLRDALRHHGIPCGIEEGYSSPWRDLTRDHEHGLGTTLGASFRKSLNRKVNRARREGAVALVPAPLGRLEDAFAISEETWQHHNGTGIGSTPALRRFYEGVAAALPDELQLAVLDVEGRPVAFELNLVSAGTAYNLKVGYREGDAALSPGTVLRRHVLDRCVSDGLYEFDFLGAEEPYKLHWATGSRLHGHIALFPHGLLHVTGPRLARYRVRAWIERRLPRLMEWKRSMQSRMRG